MAIETILLYIVTIGILWGAFLNPESGLEATFRNAGPKLGYKIEKHIETGSGFAKASEEFNHSITWGNKSGTRVEGLDE